MPTLAPAIVLIEKDELSLEIYQRELCNSFRVFAFADLNGIMDILAQQDIKAVIIEPEICGGQGWELIDGIHQVLLNRNVPIIVCSTRDASRNRKEKNIALYLTKPVLPRTLREKTLEVLTSKKRRESCE